VQGRVVEKTADGGRGAHRPPLAALPRPALRRPSS
jgi:hypothetical protein